MASRRSHSSMQQPCLGSTEGKVAHQHAHTSTFQKYSAARGRAMRLQRWHTLCAAARSCGSRKSNTSLRAVSCSASRSTRLAPPGGPRSLAALCLLLPPLQLLLPLVDAAALRLLLLPPPRQSPPPWSSSSSSSSPPLLSSDGPSESDDDNASAARCLSSSSSSSSSAPPSTSDALDALSAASSSSRPSAPDAAGPVDGSGCPCSALCRTM